MHWRLADFCALANVAPNARLPFACVSPTVFLTTAPFLAMLQDRQGQRRRDQPAGVDHRAAQAPGHLRAAQAAREDPTGGWFPGQGQRRPAMSFLLLLFLFFVFFFLFFFLFVLLFFLLLFVLFLLLLFVLFFFFFLIFVFLFFFLVLRVVLLLSCSSCCCSSSCSSCSSFLLVLRAVFPFVFLVLLSPPGHIPLGRRNIGKYYNIL